MATKTPLEGSIELILGPMFSGKTQELQRRLRRHKRANSKIVLLRPSTDNRQGTSPILTTHDKDGGHMKGTFVDAHGLLSFKIPDGTSVIGIDEGQFFFDMVDFCFRKAKEGYIIIVAALDSDYLCRPFTLENTHRITDLVAYASKVDKLCSVCKICHKDAPFSRRLGDETGTVLTGGDGNYIAVCLKCYFLPIDIVKESLPNLINDDDE